MFGWEFPPHISGGLGTACLGLTSSLSKENIEILFVIPRASGEESAEKTTFISASTIPVPFDNGLQQFFHLSQVEPSIRHELLGMLTQQFKGFQPVVVPSSLSPYHSPEHYSEPSSIQHWNYEIAGRRSKSETRPGLNVSAESASGSQAVFQFSGDYGATLMEEVRRYALVASQIAIRYEFDVIHAHDWMTYLAGIAAKRVSGKPLVVHVHATEYDRSGENVDPRVRAIEYQGMVDADCVVAVSNWTKGIAVKRYQIPEEKIAVVHNGVMTGNTPARRHAPWPLTPNIVTFLGRVTHQKGPRFFVEAARLVLDRIPDTHFIVAGAGDLLPAMIERIAQLRLSSHFHFTGFLKRKDIETVWAMSSVYVMPSVSEPFGIAPLEAIQAGVPVIISKQSGVSEVMPHAIKVDFWNSREMAAAICSVLRYKSLSGALSRNGAEQISKISWSSAAKKLTKLYYGLTAQQQCA